MKQSDMCVNAITRMNRIRLAENNKNENIIKRNSVVKPQNLLEIIPDRQIDFSCIFLLIISKNWFSKYGFISD